MEVANLSVKLSADVEQAISGLRKSDAALQKSATVASKESKKIEGFMGKMKMGWIAVAAGAIASLYAVAKSSAVIGGYFSEFGMLVGMVFDEIGIAMAPIIDPLLDFLWMLGDKFAALPEPVKAAIGIIILVGTAIAVLIPIIGLIAPAFATGIAIITPLLAGFFLFLLANPIILIIAAIIAVAVLLYIAWKKNWGGIQEKTKVVIEWFKAHDWALLFLGPIGAVILFAKKIYENWDKIKAFTKKTWETIKSITMNLWSAIGNAIWQPIKNAYNKIRDFVNMIISKIKSIPVIGSATSYIGKISKYIPSFQHGGYVPTTGLAMLHAGEYVMPANNTRNVTNSPTIVISPTIYVSGEMRTDTDLRKLASDLSVYFKDEIKRQVRG